MSKSKKKSKVFWIDTVGDDMEKRGIKPGHIFESNAQIPGYDPGVVLATYADAREGSKPRHEYEVREIFAQQAGQTVKVERRDLKRYFNDIKNKLF